MSSRTSTNISLRSADLMKDLNEVTGAEIWDDAALSESNYSGDEFDIEEGERRATLKPSNSIKKFIIPLDVVKQKKTTSHSSSTPVTPIGTAVHETKSIAMNTMPVSDSYAVPTGKPEAEAPPAYSAPAAYEAPAAYGRRTRPRREHEKNAACLLPPRTSSRREE